jgi:hypothetical protein
MNDERRRKKIQLYKIALARHDVFEAQRIFMSMAIAGSPSPYLPLQEPQVQLAVISYSRPFSKNKPFGPLPGKWSKFENPEFQEIHDFLLRARDQHVAHGDLAVREVYIAAPGATLASGDVATELTTSIRARWRAPWPISRAVDTCTDLGVRLLVEMNRLLRDLFSSRTDLPAESFKLDPDDDL